MALRFVDGFDYYPTADLPKKWSALVNDAGGFAASLSANTGRFGTGTQALLLGTYGTAGVIKTLDSQPVWYTGFAFKCSSASNFGSMLTVYDSYGQVQATFTFNAGSITYTNGLRNNYSQAATTAVTAGIWNYIEFKVKFVTSCAAGDVQVRLNGVVVLSVPAGTNTLGDFLNSSPTTASQIKFFGSGSNGGVSGLQGYIDDLYICDGTGSTNNGFLGDIRVETIFPNAAGSSTQFTPSSGNNYACVAETPEDGDTSYVASSTPGQKDIYGLADLSSTPTSVYGIQVSTVARKDDAGTRIICPIVKSGGTEYDHSSSNPFGLADGYTLNLDMWETDPNGSIPWTGTSINALNIGVKVVS